jgi:hypothetical protein
MTRSRPLLLAFALRDLGQRAVEVEDRGVVAERDRQRGDAAVGVHEAVEQGALPARLLRGVADDDEAAWQDLDGGRANAEQAWQPTTTHWSDA